MGNSEVGHLNLGAGRVVPQDLVRDLPEHPSRRLLRHRLPVVELTAAPTPRPAGTLHLVGLLGQGGVHAIDTHLLAAIELGRAARRAADRRSTASSTAATPCPDLGGRGRGRAAEDLARMAGPRGVIAPLMGRYFAMDRDRRWDRPSFAYDCWCTASAARRPIPSPRFGRPTSAARPTSSSADRAARRDGAPVAPLREGDAVFCRQLPLRPDAADRPRAGRSQGFDGFECRTGPALRCVTMTQYDQTFPFPVAFPPFSHGADPRRGAAGCGSHPVPDRRDREVPARDVLLQRRHEAPWPGRRAGPGPVARRWRPTTSRRR